MPNIVVSKSGETLETISNFNIILKSKNNKNIIITENTNNYLRRLSYKIKSDIFEHKKIILVEDILFCLKLECCLLNLWV